MKMYLLLIPIFILSGCTIDWSDEKDKKIVELEKQVTELKVKSDDELFKKNKECQSYYDKLEQEHKIYGMGQEYMPQGIIFYSKIKNTCVYGYLDSSAQPSPAFKIINVMTNEVQIIPYSNEDNNFQKANQEYSATINNLKQGQKN